MKRSDQEQRIRDALFPPGDSHRGTVLAAFNGGGGRGDVPNQGLVDRHHSNQ